jgi:hypothetical protein
VWVWGAGAFTGREVSEGGTRGVSWYEFKHGTLGMSTSLPREFLQLWATYTLGGQGRGRV